MTHIQVQNWRKCVSYVPKAHTSHTKHMVHDAFNVCSNHALFKLQWTRILKKNIYKKTAVYDSDTSVTSKKTEVVKPGMNW